MKSVIIRYTCKNYSKWIRETFQTFQTFIRNGTILSAFEKMTFQTLLCKKINKIIIPHNQTDLTNYEKIHI